MGLFRANPFRVSWEFFRGRRPPPSAPAAAPEASLPPLSTTAKKYQASAGARTLSVPVEHARGGAPPPSVTAVVPAPSTLPSSTRAKYQFVTEPGGREAALDVVPASYVPARRAPYSEPIPGPVTPSEPPRIYQAKTLSALDPRRRYSRQPQRSHYIRSKTSVVADFYGGTLTMDAGTITETATRITITGGRNVRADNLGSGGEMDGIALYLDDCIDFHIDNMAQDLIVGQDAVRMVDCVNGRIFSCTVTTCTHAAFAFGNSQSRCDRIYIGNNTVLDAQTSNVTGNAAVQGRRNFSGLYNRRIAVHNNTLNSDKVVIGLDGGILNGWVSHNTCTGSKRVGGGGEGIAFGPVIGLDVHYNVVEPDPAQPSAANILFWANCQDVRATYNVLTKATANGGQLIALAVNGEDGFIGETGVADDILIENNDLHNDVGIVAVDMYLSDMEGFEPSGDYGIRNATVRSNNVDNGGGNAYQGHDDAATWPSSENISVTP